MSNISDKIVSGFIGICAFSLCAVECNIIKSYLDRRTDEMGVPNKLRVASAASYFLVGTVCLVYTLGLRKNETSLIQTRRIFFKSYKYC